MSEPEAYTLWGDPVYLKKGKRGRPPFEWTQENSNKVSMLLAMGWTNERIAGVVLDPRTGKSISQPTLKRHFRAELAERDKERDRLFAKQIMVTAEKAFEGNVGAMKHLEHLRVQNDAMRASARVKGEGDKPKAEEKTEKLGKKELASRRAEEVVQGDAAALWGDDLKPGYEN